MKNLALVALMLGLCAVGVGIYHHVETYPNMKSFDAMSGAYSRADAALALSYSTTAWNQIYAIWGTAALGFALGLVATIKKVKLGLLGVLLSLAGFALSMTTIMISRI